MAASGNSRGHVCLRVGIVINRTPGLSALGCRSRTGSVALNTDRRLRAKQKVAGLPGLPSPTGVSFSNVCSAGRREDEEGADGNAVWLAPDSVSEAPLHQTRPLRFGLAVQVRTAKPVGKGGYCGDCDRTPAESRWSPGASESHGH